MRDGGAPAFFCSDSGRCFVGAFRRFLRGLAFSRFGSGPELKEPIFSNQKIIKNYLFSPPTGFPSFWEPGPS